MAHFHNDGVITVSLVRRVNKAAIEGKRYAQQIDAAVPRLPKLTAAEAILQQNPSGLSVLRVGGVCIPSQASSRI